MKTVVIVILIFVSLGTRGQGNLVSTSVIKIDCDYMHPFQEGFAVVTKGSAWGIIDSKGKFLVPYGTYVRASNGFVNGYCAVVAKSGKWGYVDRTGKLAVPCIYTYVESFDEDGYAYTNLGNSGDAYLIKANGQQTKLPYNVRPGVYVNGVFDRTGKLIDKTRNYDAGVLSEGLAAVSRLDEFGKEKWGFLDRNAKTIIPFQFTYRPRSFSDGLSLVTPVDQTKFNYGYIDKTGKLVLEVTQGKLVQFSGSRPDELYDFSQGFAVCKYNIPGNWATLLFRDGGVKGFNDILKHPKGKNSTIASIRRGQILIQVAGKFGIADKDGNILVEPKFSSLEHFDPVSNLSKAVYQSSDVNIEGYINRQGIFTITKAPPSTF